MILCIHAVFGRANAGRAYFTDSCPVRSARRSGQTIAPQQRQIDALEVLIPRFLERPSQLPRQLSLFADEALEAHRFT
jgi:hypothetical protein